MDELYETGIDLQYNKIYSVVTCNREVCLLPTRGRKKIALPYCKLNSKTEQ